jgi:hypothetical protein
MSHRLEEDLAMNILPGLVIASVVALGGVPSSAEHGRALAIVAPSDQRMIFDDGGSVVISLAADPPLAQDEVILLRVDDEIVALPAGLTKLTLSRVPSGPHVLEALLVDADSNPVVAAPSVTFDVGAWLRI